MSAAGERILSSLQAVAEQRLLRRQQPGLSEIVQAIKAYQHARFKQTYTDMLAHPRYGGGALFFLEDLYGPGDFSTRDDQFARIVPGLVRMFPHDIVGTVQSLGELHALSEQLDTAMAQAWRQMAAGDATPAPGTAVDGVRYAECWRSVGNAAARERQIALMMAVGEALETYTRNPLLRTTLRLMRGPAQAAGLGALQGFLERGFDTFRAMRGAREFLGVISTRERALAASLFAGADAPRVPVEPA